MKLRRTLIVLSLAAACGPTPTHKGHPGDGSNDPNGIPSDVAAALAALPEATVLMYTQDGLPTYIVGEMGKVNAMQDNDPVAAEAALRPALPPVLAPMRLHTSDLVLRKINVDDQCDRHFRYTQKFNGCGVIGRGPRLRPR